MFFFVALPILILIFELISFVKTFFFGSISMIFNEFSYSIFLFFVQRAEFGFKEHELKIKSMTNLNILSTKVPVNHFLSLSFDTWI